MPSLKDLHCFIELTNADGDTNQHLREFGTTYGDGSVETYVAVPNRTQRFAVRLSSTKFIAPGLAMYVFIDGVYQCNRNRQNLKLRRPLDRKSLVDFVVRQKEERQEDGSMIARDWSFEKLDIVSVNDSPEVWSNKKLKHLGCIEVVVLRCGGPRNANTPDTKPFPMHLDGAGDEPDHLFGLDGGWSSSSISPQYDDRAFNMLRNGSRYGAPTRAPSFSNSGPPPPLPSRLRGREEEYYDIVDSPPYMPASHIRGIANSPEHLSASVRYSSGPVPHQSRVASLHGPAPSITGAPSALPFDPRSLDNKLLNMVQREHAGYQPSQAHPSPAFALDAPSSNLPGSWPGQFGGGDSPLVSPMHNLEPGPSIPFPPPPDAAFGLQPPKQSPHNSRPDNLARPLHGSLAGTDNGWQTGEEDNNADSWDTNDASSSVGQANGCSRDKQGRGRNRSSDSWEFPRRARHTSPASRSARTDARTNSSDFHSARSRPLEPVWESGVDNSGWTYVNADPSSTASWVMAHAQSVHPSESVSHAAATSAAGPPPSQAPLANELTSRLLSIKNDESRRRSVAASQPATVAPSANPWDISHFKDGLSTFEKMTRAASGHVKPSSIWQTEDPKNELYSWGTMQTNPSAVASRTDPRAAGHGIPTKEIVALQEPKYNSEDWNEPTKKSTNDHGRNEDRVFRQSGGWTSGPRADKTEFQNTSTVEKPKSVTKESSWHAPAKPKYLPNSVDSWQASLNGWSSPNKAKSIVDDPNPWGSAPDTKQQPRKSRLSKYRQLRGATPDIEDTSHRQLPPPAPVHKSKPDLDAEPPLKIRKEDATKKGVDHQVRAGKGSKYGHAIGRPEYLDTLDKPYAVFRFHYRSHAALTALLGPSVVPSDPSFLTTSPADHLALGKAKEDPKDVKQQLNNVPKEALIDGLLDMQKKLEKAKLEKTDEKGGDRVKDWVKGQSREGDERRKHRKHRKERKDDPWGRKEKGGRWDKDSEWDKKSDW